MRASPAFLIAQADPEILDNALTSRDWFQGAGIVLGTIVLAMVVSRVLRRGISHGLGPGFAAMMLARLGGYAVVLIGLFYALATLGVRVGPLLGALGLGGLVLALALQRVVENFVSSIILQARRPFTVGETVDIDGHVGVVADIDSRTTLLRSLDGSHVRIPNVNVVSETIVNLTREPIRRSALDVGVVYDTDLHLASCALNEAFARVPRVVADPPPSVNLIGFGESSIDFRLLYWHSSDVPSELAARHDLVIAVHEALASEEVTIAFPQMVVWGSTETTAGGPYDQRSQVVMTPYPALENGQASGRKRLAPQLRRPGRRKKRDAAD